MIQKALYWMVSGIYSFVARVYDIMISLATSGNDAGTIDNFYISSTAVAIYTIAGVFMLFRVTIAMINYLINPDQISDRSAGAGKIITRIITSIALLIIFVPDGFIFGNDGILKRIEKAVLTPNGLISNIIPESLSMESGSGKTSNKNKKEISNSNGMDCYFVDIDKYIKQEGRYSQESVSTQRPIHISDIYHLRFYNNSTDGEHQICYSKVNTTTATVNNNSSSDCPFSYDFIQDNDGFSNKFNPNKAIAIFKDGNALSRNHNNAFQDGKFLTKCPREVHKFDVLDSSGRYGLKNKYYAGANKHWFDAGTGILGGWSSEATLKRSISAHYKEIDSDSSFIKAIQLSKDDNRDYLVDVDQSAIDFAQMTMGTFIECNDTNECEAYKKNSLIKVDGDEAISDALAKNTMHLEALPAMIAGVGILAWVVMMCVEVIIRRFKLLLLQMIAPIPIISYSDPKDKMFGQWSKMYISTYLDLFLKLIAISFGIGLLKMVDQVFADSDGLIEKFFYIVAILVFVKMIPSMISKVFGIDSLGGSFKDIMGMGKAALGFGAGAAIGGAVGAATGTGLGMVSGFAKGALMGAGSGSKGNLTGGAKSVAATNALKAQGLNWFDRLKYSGLGALGIDPNISQRHDLDQIKQAKEQVKNINSRIGDVEGAVDRTPEVEAFKRAIANGVVSDPTGAKLKALKEAYGNAYDNAKFDKQNNKYLDSTINFSDIGGGISESDFKAVYGENATTLSVANGSWGSGYRDAKKSLVNAIKMVNSDKESVEFINKYASEQAGALLGGLDGKTDKGVDKNSFKYITGDLKGSTFTPMKTLDDIEVAKAQELSFSERKTKAGK